MCNRLDERGAGLFDHVAEGAEYFLLVAIEVGNQLVDVDPLAAPDRRARRKQRTLFGAEVETEELTSEEVGLTDHRDRIFLDRGSGNHIEIDSDTAVLDGNHRYLPDVHPCQPNGIASLYPDCGIEIGVVFMPNFERVPVLDEFDHHPEGKQRQKEEETDFLFRVQGHATPPP